MTPNELNQRIIQSERNRTFTHIAKDKEEQAAEHQWWEEWLKARFSSSYFQMQAEQREIYYAQLATEIMTAIDIHCEFSKETPDATHTTKN